MTDNQNKDSHPLKGAIRKNWSLVEFIIQTNSCSLSASNCSCCRVVGSVSCPGLDWALGGKMVFILSAQVLWTTGRKQFSGQPPPSEQGQTGTKHKLQALRRPVRCGDNEDTLGSDRDRRSVMGERTEREVGRQSAPTLGGPKR